MPRRSTTTGWRNGRIFSSRTASTRSPRSRTTSAATRRASSMPTRRAMLRDRVTALRRANIYERQSYRHIIGLPLVTANEAGGIAAETPFLVVRIMRDGSSDLFATGIYLDTCGKRRRVCVSSSASRSATARISTRCSPFPFSFPGVRADCDVSGMYHQAPHYRGAAASAAEYSGAGRPGALTGAP